jgi:hypothetical protein
VISIVASLTSHGKGANMEIVEQLPAQDGLIAPAGSRQCFKALIEHWAKARIDGPMQAVARYDDAAKQLVTIGSLMQGLLVVAYSLTGKQPGFQLSGLQPILIWAFLAFLILFFICAAGVCWTQPKMDAVEIHQFLIKTLAECFSETDLSGMIKNWCKDIDRIRRLKRRWLTGASVFFMLCSVMMVVLLLFPFMPSRG